MFNREKLPDNPNLDPYPNLTESLVKLHRQLKIISLTYIQLSLTYPENILVIRFRKYVKNYYELEEISMRTKLKSFHTNTDLLGQISPLFQLLLDSVNANISILENIIENKSHSDFQDTNFQESLPEQICDSEELKIIKLYLPPTRTPRIRD